MNQTVEWICFVIGGILILTAVLTSIFKINLGGASVEGQSHWTQKIVAFFAGWVFVIIGAVFHGVAMSNIPGGTPTQTSQQQTLQPTTVASSNSVDQNRASDSEPPAKREAPREPEETVAGVWIDQFGVRHQISQDGDELVMTTSNAAGGTGQGSGQVNGTTVSMVMTIDVMSRNCTVQISNDRRRMSGRCSYPHLGTVEEIVLTKIG